MKYKAGTRRRAAEYEKALARWWKKNKVFEKSVEQRPEDDSYVFYDGPPFITGMPHHGTLLSSIVKDAVPRFWTMRGKRVERRWGWDCHGLPAENFVEKQLGITDRREIGTKWSLEDYILKARESMVANSETWEGTIDRIGRWVDFRGAYRTMDKDFMESVWWAFKTLYEAGKIYEGRKVLMYDTKFATPVSKSEVTMDNDAYQEVTDPSAYVKFELTEESVQRLLSSDSVSLSSSKDSDPAQPSNNPQAALSAPVYLLAWTTTPWTLPANMALAVNPEMEYVAVRVREVEDDVLVQFDDGQEDLMSQTSCLVLILAKSRVEDVLKDVQYQVIRDGIKGKDFDGLSYKPLFGKVADVTDEGMSGKVRHTTLDFDGGVVSDYEAPMALGDMRDNFEKARVNTHKVYSAGFVSDSDGTGIVHIAPAYGEDDYRLSQEKFFLSIDVLDDFGYYLESTAKLLHELGVRDTDERGIEIWAGNKFIAKCLEERGIVWKIEYIKHEYPFNPRSKQRIMYRAFPSWFFDVQGQKPLMIEQNENINWFPGYLKEGRFKKNIEQAPDWNLSRDRFWATAMPVWKGDKGTVKVVGSYDELYELSGVRLEDYHRPWVDGIEFEIDGEKFKRIEKVLDCWFESGSMPFAELHYPFENKEKFERNYPADFIVEYVGQVRAWFYYVHCVNTALAEVGGFGNEAQEKAEKNAFKNVITTGTLAGNDGRKMSKSLGNYTDPNELMDKFSADALRFLLLSSPVLSGEDFALTDKDVSDVNRKLAMIWNVYDFFTTYAEVDGWEFVEGTCCLNPGDVNNPLDKWIVSRVHELRDRVTEGMERYDLPSALSPILPFVDDLSNWFVRRSRRRFWKSEDDGDKAEAYWTLHYVMVKLALILAPFAPFLAEELWQNLVGDGNAEKSVHLKDWPEAKEIDGQVLDQMARVREVINEGLRLRMYADENEQQVKVRQPLGELVYNGDKLPEWGEEIVRDEVNVKKVTHGDKMWVDKMITDELAREGWTRELVRAVQSARKKAGLVVDDRIRLSVDAEVPEEWREMLKNEVLAEELVRGENYAYDEIVKVNGENVTISLEKV